MTALGHAADAILERQSLTGEELTEILDRFPAAETPAELQSYIVSVIILSTPPPPPGGLSPLLLHDLGMIPKAVAVSIFPGWVCSCNLQWRGEGVQTSRHGIAVEA